MSETQMKYMYRSKWLGDDTMSKARVATNAFMFIMTVSALLIRSVCLSLVWNLKAVLLGYRSEEAQWSDGQYRRWGTRQQCGIHLWMMIMEEWNQLSALASIFFKTERSLESFTASWYQKH